jgi:thioredoxin-like negative regulator of GroEL
MAKEMNLQDIFALVKAAELGFAKKSAFGAIYDGICAVEEDLKETHELLGEQARISLQYIDAFAEAKQTAKALRRLAQLTAKLAKAYCAGKTVAQKVDLIENVIALENLTKNDLKDLLSEFVPESRMKIVDSINPDLLKR